jgi:hypothetical protein
MTTILTANGLLEIPEEFREVDALKPGQRCEIERLGLGQYHVQVRDEKPPVRESWVSILRECPVKDWWEPLDHSNLLITRDNARLFDEADKDAS